MNDKNIKAITEFIFVEDNPSKSDIILIPGGSKPELIIKAVELYHHGYAKYILPSGGFNEKISGFISEYEYLKNIAVNRGVPDNIILREDKACHTFENAQFSWKIIQQQNVQVTKAILICKAHHSRRALLSYQTVFPDNIKFTVCPIVDNRNVTKDNWHLDKEKIKMVMGEVEKIGKYFVEHWNKY